MTNDSTIQRKWNRILCGSDLNENRVQWKYPKVQVFNIFFCSKETVKGRKIESSFLILHYFTLEEQTGSLFCHTVFHRLTFSRICRGSKRFRVLFPYHFQKISSHEFPFYSITLNLMPIYHNRKCL